MQYTCMQPKYDADKSRLQFLERKLWEQNNNRI